MLAKGFEIVQTRRGIKKVFRTYFEYLKYKESTKN